MLAFHHGHPGGAPLLQHLPARHSAAAAAGEHGSDTKLPAQGLRGGEVPGHQADCAVLEARRVRSIDILSSQSLAVVSLANSWSNGTCCRQCSHSCKRSAPGFSLHHTGSNQWSPMDRSDGLNPACGLYLLSHLSRCRKIRSLAGWVIRANTCPGASGTRAVPVT